MKRTFEASTFCLLAAMIMTSTSHVAACANDFICPVNSYRKPNRKCYDSIADCECKSGYFWDNNECVAEHGLCTESFADRLIAEADAVDYWMYKAETTMASSFVVDGGDGDVDMVAMQHTMEYLFNMNEALALAWKDYNRGQASCDMYGPALRDRQLRSGHDGRELFGRIVRDVGRRVSNTAGSAARTATSITNDAARRAREAAERAAREAREAAERAAREAAEAADEVARAGEIAAEAALAAAASLSDIIGEFVECGIGIIDDGPRCGAIGCAFGLVGTALDIIFEAKTGGVGPLVDAICEGVLGIAPDDLVKIIRGIGATVCALDEAIDSPVLARVCFVYTILEDGAPADIAERAIALVIDDPVVLRFVSAFREALCGSPGSAILDILEEVVVCEIDCAADDNVFCPVGDPEPIIISPPGTRPITLPPPITVSTPATIALTLPPPITVPADEYVGRPNTACRTPDGSTGRNGEDFMRFNIERREECEALCSANADCTAYEFRRGHCEIWESRGVVVENVSGLTCQIKQRTVEFRYNPGKACRTRTGGLGDEGSDFHLEDVDSAETCRSACSVRVDCLAYEFSGNSRCELWKTLPTRLEERSGFVCAVKLDD